MRTSLCLALGVALYLGMHAFPAPAAQAPFRARVEAVVDGDSLELIRGGVAVAVRLYGIDCPEWEQPQGGEARRFTADLAAGREVTVRVRATDGYGRLVAEVLLPDGRSLNRELVAAGQAWWYRHYAPDAAELKRLETAARAAGRGLWGQPNPVPPWRWRREHQRRSRPRKP